MALRRNAVALSIGTLRPRRATLGTVGSQRCVGQTASRHTQIGHLNLRVTNLAAAEVFYAGMLGFDVIARYEADAVFVSAGGYHGHIGLNTWGGPDAPPPPPESIGLRRFEIHLPDTDELDPVIKQVQDAGVDLEETPAGAIAHDPSSHILLLTTSTRDEATTQMTFEKR